MKKRIQVCQQCGHEQEVFFYTAEEVRREQVMTSQPCCKQCRSFNVKIK